MWLGEPHQQQRMRHRRVKVPEVLISVGFLATLASSGIVWYAFGIALRLLTSFGSACYGDS